MLDFETFFARYFAAPHAAALAREQSEQAEAFLDITHTVAGFELRALTAQDLLILQGCENPFIVGGAITPEALAQFFALLVQPAPRGWWARRRFFRALRARPYVRTVAEVQAYLDRIFGRPSDAAQSPAAEDGQEPAASPPLSTCFLAPLVLSIACETGWPESDILAMRLDRLFQYQRVLHTRATGRSRYPSADALISRALEAHARYLATGELPTDPAPPQVPELSAAR